MIDAATYVAESSAASTRARERSAVALNPTLLVIQHALFMSLVPVAILPLFWRDELQMSFTAILFAQAVFGATIAALEFPSGYIADRIGCKKTLVLGSVLATVGWAGYAMTGSFVELLFWTAFLGVGFALMSGADTALLYESLKETGEEKKFGRWFGRMRFAGQVCEGTAALAAGILYATWNRLPMVLMVVLWTLMTVVSISLREPSNPAQQRKPHEGHLAHVRSLFSFAFAEQPKLRGLLVFGVVLAVAAFVPGWVIPIYAIDSGVPTEWVGPIWAIGNYVVAFGALISARGKDRFGLKTGFVACIALTGVGYFGLGLTDALFGFAFFYLLSFMRGVSTPLLAHEQQKLIPSEDRASLSSLASLLFRGSYMVLCPIIGLAVDSIGMHAVLTSLGVLFVVSAVAAWRLVARANDEAPMSGWVGAGVANEPAPVSMSY